MIHFVAISHLYVYPVPSAKDIIGIDFAVLVECTSLVELLLPPSLLSDDDMFILPNNGPKKTPCSSLMATLLPSPPLSSLEITSCVKDTLALFLGLEGAGLEKEDFSNDFLDPLLGLLLGGACDVVDIADAGSAAGATSSYSPSGPSAPPVLQFSASSVGIMTVLVDVTTKNYWRMYGPVLSLIALRCLSVVPFLRLRGFDDDDAMRCYETTKNYWRM